MQKQHLQMKYHPAKKEVEFTRFAAGQPVVIRTDSKLCKYMNEKGKFVLQDHGNSFFEDIAEAFDGEKTVHIEVVTTKNDYEDFAQMIEYYNEEPSASVKITATLLAELPDMEEAYRVVRDHGMKSVEILKKHRSQFFDVPLDNPDVKKCVDIFATDVQKEVDSILAKIDSMGDNSINLCFTGVYSAGKSALINAILGHQILPESIKSETNRMFKIQSPKKNEPVRIVFSILSSYAELLWNDESNTFVFGAAPSEDSTRKIIQNSINEHNSEVQYRQVYEILKTLNTTNDVNPDIKIYFPIALDSDRIQFTIYDTPGTDSNYGEHQRILEDALSEQTHSILIFVAAPNKVEGTGNNALLSLLKKAEKKDAKTSIDIGRSLFVMNWADSIGPDARRDLQQTKIRLEDDDDFSIKLSDKKLFFTSARVAYAAKAEANKIATEDDEFIIEQQSRTINNKKFGCYYLQNRVATSEYRTLKLHEYCDEALAAAENNNDILKILHICSGLYALETEITAYGEKYASAVRAFAIIDSVEKALAAMNNNAKSLDRRNLEDINKINAEIEEVRATIVGSIRIAGEKYSFLENEKLPPEIVKNLNLDENYLQTDINGPALSFIKKLLKKGFFGIFGKVKFKEAHKKEVTQKITSVLNDYTNEFLVNRQVELEWIRDNFIDDVKRAIHTNGKISEEAKNFIVSIRPPEIEKPANLVELGEIYDNNARTEKFLWMDKQYLDKEGFIEGVDIALSQITANMADDYADDFRLTLTSVVSAIDAEFTQNIEKYSVLMRAKLADKEVMERLRAKIAAVAGDLIACQKELNGEIWREVKESV